MATRATGKGAHRRRSAAEAAAAAGGAGRNGSPAKAPGAKSKRRSPRREGEQAPRPRRKGKDSVLQTIRRMTHEFHVQREEIRVQNEQLIESQRLLEESRDRYAALYDYAPVAYVTLDAHGVIREINRAGSALLGLPPGRLMETPLVLFVASRSRRKFLNHLRACRMSFAVPAPDAAPVTTELVLRPRDGREIEVQLLSVALSSSTEGPRYQSAIVDLADRRRAERESERLKSTEASERLFRDVLGALPAGGLV